jgi:hypothetical protein
LDCHSLQTSLKRIRLSCSSGELRLQRDLTALSHFGWQTVEHETGDAYLPQWRMGRTTTLTLLDPLRLQFRVSTVSLWIQIPRMYPHRPPVIARTDCSPVIFVITDSPLGLNDGMLQHNPEGSAIMEWSPIRQIGDLLTFVLEHLSLNKSPEGRRTTICTSHSHFTPVAPFPSLSTTPLTSSTADSSWQQPDDRYFIEEEHKLEHLTRPSRGTFQELLPPNRFDAGYGKYQDLLGSSIRLLQPSGQHQHRHRHGTHEPQQSDPYAMEM